MQLRPTGRRRTIAELDCVVVDPSDQPYEPQAIAILCHGFGAPSTDLVDCCRAMWELQPIALARVRFVFPAGPMKVDPSGLHDGRAWWPIDMERLNFMMTTGQYRDLRFERPELLATRSRQLRELAEHVLAETNLDSSALVLGGFSQGAMLATDVALRLSPAPGGLIVWSGTLLNEAEWRAAAKRQTRFPVVQSHGRMDPILPFAGAEWLREILAESNFSPEFIPFDGMHEIPMAAIRGAAELIARVAAEN